MMSSWYLVAFASHGRSRVRSRGGGGAIKFALDGYSLVSKPIIEMLTVSKGQKMKRRFGVGPGVVRAYARSQTIFLTIIDRDCKINRQLHISNIYCSVGRYSKSLNFSI